MRFTALEVLLTGTLLMTAASVAKATEPSPTCGGHDMGPPQEDRGRDRHRDRHHEEDAPEPPRAPPPVQSRIRVEVTEKGFEPAQIDAKKDEWIEFVFTRRTDKTCVEEVIFDLGNNETIRHTLPLGQPVSFLSKFKHPGPVPFACGMKMVRGTLIVR